VAVIRIVLYLTLTATALAQNRSVILGSVHDGSGAAIPDASVAVLNEATGIRRAARTDEHGRYAASTLPAGSYKITVRKPEFRTVVRLGVEVAASQTARVDFILEIGDVHETITVRGGAELMNTEDGSSRIAAGRADVERLPASVRGLHGVLEMTPGVTITPASGGEAGQFTANGQRPNANYFLVDGLSANSAVTGSGLISEFPGGALPAMTAIGSLHALAGLREVEEVRIHTSSFAPEFGRLPGAQVAITTRSGSNDLHGEAFYAITHEALSANNWFANRAALGEAATRLHNGAASIGGPLRRNRTFFFGSFETLRLRQPYTWRMATPSEGARAAAPAHLRPVIDRFPRPNGATLSPTLGEHTGQVTLPASVTSGSFRLDHAIGARGAAFLRYKETPSESRSGYLSPNYASFRSRSATLGVISGLTPRVVNDTRINVSRTSVRSSWLETVNLSPVLPPSNVVGLRALWIGGMGQLVSGEEDRVRQSQWNLASTLAVTAGRHQVRLGLDYQRLTPTRQSALTAVTGAHDSLDRLIAGVAPSLAVFQAGFGSSLIEVLSAFAQDSWAVTPRLNVSWGARWEFTPAPSFRTPGLGDGHVTVFPPGVPLPRPVSVAIPEFMPAAEATPIWSSSYTQFAPRLGAAWRANRPGTMVVRVGAGIFYHTGFASATELLNGAPFNRWRTLTTGLAESTPPIEFGYAPDLRLPYAAHWNLTLERTVSAGSALAIGYVGSSGARLMRREGYPVPGSGTPQIVIATNHGRSSYHSLQAQYRGGLARGVSGLLSYTWGHSIDNVSWDSAVYLADPGRGFTRDRASSAYDAKHSFQAAVSWDAPWRLFTLSATARARSGFPIDPLTVEKAFGLGFDNLVRPDLVPGQPIWLPGRRLNPHAFARPDDDHQGSLGRNAIRGFGLAQADVAVQREFPLERGSLRLQIESRNVTNHPSFADPVAILSHPLFGQTASMLNLMLGRGRPNTGLTPALQPGSPRTIQFSLLWRF
jgi:hypothetical protein